MISCFRYYDNFDDELIQARYVSLLPYVPVVILAATGSLLTQVASFGKAGPFFWSILIPLGLTLVSTNVFIYWLIHRKETPDISTIRKRMNFCATLLILAGLATISCAISLLQHTTGYSQYFLILEMALYGMLFPFILVNLGVPAYLYNLLLISTTLIFTLYLNVAFAKPLAFMIFMFEIGMLSAMHSRTKGFDSLVFSSIRASKLATENEHLANLDTMTELPNRRQFFSIIKSQQLEELKASNSRFVVGIIDLDKFKLVNDAYGHNVGDLILMEVAHRLQAFKLCVNKVHFYRLGGDEFAFHKKFDGDDSALKKLGAALVTEIEKPIHIDSFVFNLSACIGIATFPDVSISHEQLYPYADYALHYAKSIGHGRTELFSDLHLLRLMTRTKIEQALRQSDPCRDFSLVFQPIIHLKTGLPIAFECLARWESVELGNISPVTFIPIAENVGMVSIITLVLFEKAILAMREWPDNLGLSFNLSANDIINDKVIKDILLMVHESKLSPERFTFELTETALLQDFNATRKNIELLREHGLVVSLDDFGTGYSSLSHVQNLSLSKIKVDKSFVNDIETNSKSKMIVSSILELCSGIGVDCVVEGAETASQVDLLQTMGCTIIQGYFFSKPMTQVDVLRYIQSKNIA